jgi:hypothetical protein
MKTLLVNLERSDPLQDRRQMEGNASLDVPVLKIEVGGSSEANVTWNLNHPIVQVLVLRAVLHSRGCSLNRLDNARPERYVIFSGTGMISRPGMFHTLHRERLQAYPDLYEKLEAKRAMQERGIRETDGPRGSLWLLTAVLRFALRLS